MPAAKPSPGALPAAKVAELLSAAGHGVVTEAEILDDVSRGAPQRDDGLIPLIPYIRWLHVEAVSHGR